MKSAYKKDILRTIKKNFKRFLALTTIMALGLTAFIGIVAACQDLYAAADRFYDAQNLFDIQILSTLGLTDDDIKALENIKGIDEVEGAFNQSASIKVKNLDKKVQIRNVSNEQMNRPYLLKGKLPKNQDEIAVTRDFLTDANKKIGDTLQIEEKKDSILKQTEFKITGTVIDPLNVNNPDGAAMVRDTNTSDYNFFATTKAFDEEVYTVAYLSVKGVKELDGYSKSYKSTIKETIKEIEDKLQDIRQEARYEELYQSAKEKIDEEQTKADEEFAKADQEISKAKAELEDGKNKYQEGKKQLNDSLAKWQENQELITQNEAQLKQKEEEANAGFEEAQAVLAEKEEKLYASLNQLSYENAELKAAFGEQWPADAYNRLVEGATISAKNQLLANPDVDEETLENVLKEETQTEQEELLNAMMTSGAEAMQGNNAQTLIENVIRSAIAKGSIEGGLSALNDSRTAFEAQKVETWNQLSAGWTEINEGKEQLNQGKSEIDQGYEELNSSYQEIEKGEKELAENETTLTDKKEEAQKELAKATKKLSEIKKARWYVQDRYSLSSYTSMDSDLKSIEIIGKAFPILFLVIAILISLTTMTRMVEEERSLLGTYKALGYKGVSIGWKYVAYALAACLLGGILGNVLGSVGLPSLLRPILRALYDIPNVKIEANILYGILGTLLFLVSIILATIIVTANELRKSPASLMRPKAPKPGSRILLERIKVIWKRLKFLNKVTARNLFRYKKRLFMTLVGIAGCTALVLVGFAIRDSVKIMIPNQYEDIYRYDVMAVGNGEDDLQLIEEIKAKENVKDTITLRMENVKLFNKEGETESVPMIVVPKEVDLSSYIYTKEVKGKLVSPDEKGILVTRNIAKILSLGKGEKVRIQDLDLGLEDMQVSHIVDNYLGNSIYISEELYEEKFGNYESNAIYVHLKDNGKSAQKSFVKDIEKNENTATINSVEEQKSSFSANFSLINYVIYLLIILAAGLAFVVLFTLANTNISERSRELATIKFIHTLIKKQYY